MAEVMLIGCLYSPTSCRIEIGLKLKGVDYEFIHENLSNKSDLLLKHNPVHKKVPVLVHNGKPIAESLIILEYIDETWEGPNILPKDPYERSRARFWAKFIDEKCLIPMYKACWSKREEREKSKEEAKQMLKVLEDEINGKKFFGGDNIGLVDISAIFIAYWFVLMSEVTGLELLTKTEFPNLCEWVNEFVDNRFVKESLPPREKLLAVLKSFTQPAGPGEFRPKV